LFKGSVLKSIFGKLDNDQVIGFVHFFGFEVVLLLRIAVGKCQGVYNYQ